MKDVRYGSHLVPYKELNVGGYADLSNDDERAARIRADYERYLDARAALVHEAIRELCAGRRWPS